MRGEQQGAGGVADGIEEAEDGGGAVSVVRGERKDNAKGFDWAGFFRNPYILLQILLYVYLFYTKLPGLDELGALLVWIALLLPMCVLNLVGTHVLKELADKRKCQRPA